MNQRRETKELGCVFASYGGWENHFSWHEQFRIIWLKIPFFFSERRSQQRKLKRRPYTSEPQKRQRQDFAFVPSTSTPSFVS